MFESNGEVVRDKLNDDEFVAISDPYYEDSQWMIDISQDDAIMSDK